MTTAPTIPTPDPASFRDPRAQIHLDGDRVLRALDDAGAQAFRHLGATTFYERAQRDGDLIATRIATTASASMLRDAGWAEVLEHERVPVVSYPYEWSFAMMKDAALLHLAVVQEAVREGLACRDGSAFNVQFLRSMPVFIDVGSFESLDGPAWPGYRQFCSHFLYPLLIEAHLGVDPAPLLRGSLEGIAPESASKLLRGRAAIAPGVVAHVKAQSLAARHLATRRDPAAGLVEDPDTQRRITLGLVARLIKLVRSLETKAKRSTWSDYGGRAHYSDRSLHAKDRFVAEVLAASSPQRVFDLGCNDGRYSMMAADAGATVVAADADREVIDRLYRSLRTTRPTVQPLVFDLADPSPALGWALREREPLTSRFHPDVTLALAVIHHVVIGRSVPAPRFLDVVGDLSSTLVLEVPHRGDPKVEQLLAAKPLDTHDRYHQDAIDHEIRLRFEVVSKLVLEDGPRTTYHLRRLQPRA